MVAATNERGELAHLSNYGKVSVDLAAPGVDIPILKSGGGEEVSSGTSYSAPYVANIAAKIKKVNPRLTPRQIIAILRDSVDKTSELQTKVKYGGIVNERRALDLAQSTVNKKKAN